MTNSTSTRYGYGIIIDAGSSGSRTYLYRWPKEDRKTNSLVRVDQDAIFNDERSIGINSEGGIDALKELISTTKSALPSDTDSNDVPIYLGATAGMRLATNADTIMSNIKSTLQSSGFLFKNEWARVLSGNEESMYGWLAVNYLKNDGTLSADSSKTFGALDLGGASTQVSMAVVSSLSNAVAADDQSSVIIGNLHYSVYSKSYLHFGADQARLRYDDKHASSSKVSPCYATGYTSDTGISGSSNWDECFDNVAKLFQHSNLRGNGGGDIYITAPPMNDNTQFIAMSVFVFVYDFLGLQSESTTDDLLTLKEKAGYVCNLTHEEQITQYDLAMDDKPHGRKTNKPYAQCFNAAFTYHLLTKGYNFREKNTPIEVHYDISGNKVQWALGMMLVEANKLHWSGDVKGKIDSVHDVITSNALYLHYYLLMTFLLLSVMLLILFRSGRIVARLRGKRSSQQ